jgi:hypothetical protein
MRTDDGSFDSDDLESRSNVSGGLTKRQRRQAKRDAQYRRQLGQTESDPLPKVLGSGSSPEPSDDWKARKGSRRANPLSYRGKRKVRGRGVAPDAPPVALTLDERRSVKCPRCLAAKGQPCRNQNGHAVSGDHADRRWKAREVLRRKLIRRIPKDKPLTPEEHTELAARKKRVHDPARTARHPLRTDQGLNARVSAS